MAMPPRSSLPQANAAIAPILGVTLLALGLALVFFLFFQISKGEPFRGVNPFGEDPYDAVGSIGVEVALFVSAWSFARALRLHQAPALPGTIRFIARGDRVVLGAVGLTLLTDIAAEVAAPPPRTGREAALLAGLALLSLLTLAVGLRHHVVFKRIDAPPAPNDLTPAEALEDLWTAFVFVLEGAHVMPARVMEAARGFRVRRVLAGLPWIDPQIHPWRFAAVTGLALGVGLTIAQLREGPPPSLAAGLLVAGLFILIEWAAVMLGFAVLGGYLGLRPTIRRSRQPRTTVS